MDDQRTDRMGFGVGEDSRGCLVSMTIICAVAFLVSAVAFAVFRTTTGPDHSLSEQNRIVLALACVPCLLIAALSALGLLVCSVIWTVVLLRSKIRK